MSETTTPAIGFSITANVDGNRQIVFQGFFEQDEDDTVANARLDRVMRLTDRQRALYELPTLKAERQKYISELAQYEEDVATAEVEYKKAQAAVDVQILEFNANKQEAKEAGYAAHIKGGRQGAYVPKGATERSIALAEQSIENAKAEKLKNDAEREQFLQSVAIAVQRREVEVAKLNEKIGDLEKALGG